MKRKSPSFDTAENDTEDPKERKHVQQRPALYRQTPNHLGRAFSDIMMGDTGSDVSRSSRHIYETIVRNEETARETLLDIAKEAITYIPRATSLEPESKITICYRGTCTELNGICTFGRLRILCDISVDQKRTDVSRLHCVMIHHGNRLYFIDVGSLQGFTIQRVSINGKITTHVQNSICIPSDETVIISCGSETFTVNPKKCVVCMDRARSVVFHPCMHFTACDRCNIQLQFCPVCRTEKVSTLSNVCRLETHCV